MPDEERAGSAADRVSFWHLVKKNLPSFILMGGVIITLVTLYNEVTFISTVVNPEAMAKWRSERAKRNADVEAMKVKIDQRHCMVKVIIGGNNSPQDSLACLD